ncbi:hypothetical protein Fmac_009638 [Flemingia macrophylla]|uniref:Uncharacterized protein n=1 Tax=Flemingia macrophylla TaxID=520843 RepID=A0ABD1N0U1_9FABA
MKNATESTSLVWSTKRQLKVPTARSQRRTCLPKSRRRRQISRQMKCQCD